MVEVKSPAIAFVGRHNSGKTTLVVKVIGELSARGFRVGSVKHHSHVGFQIDVPGKDSFRHREAGAVETVIAAPGQVARIATVEGELECADIVAGMPGHDIVLVEGFRKAGLPTIEVMRAANAADCRAAAVFARGAREGWSLTSDFTQLSRAAAQAERAGGEGVASDERSGDAAVRSDAQAAQASPHPRAADDPLDVSQKLPGAATVAAATDIPEAIEAAGAYGIPVFGLDDVAAIADFIEGAYVRPKVSVVIQAGGRSVRMGRSKATVPFAGRPLICRMVERMQPIADELIVTTNEPENLAFLGELYPDWNIRLVSDEFEERGALPGLYTALHAATHPYVAVIACDMLFASPRLVAAEADVMTREGADAVVPSNKHGFEPFHALYRKSACEPVAHQGVLEGERRAQYVIRRVNLRPFPQAEVLSVEPMGGCFVNVNTPEELACAERWYLDEG
ncbi:molybdopterin-guanine dinucleotide biosynthesis protein B [Berryella wangjianweii]|uniref:Probable molybdenum cofactor guanylyltransferase n=1 Tax=Berryella wangjianweii TaxID=2734634 RepID=A0A6M8J7X1_9ACTN|nr:molybdopterin-guanine dinucleotide biosynthesis protein B [Berryella wangjianweii]QKF07638.1 molybdopterin-guanine dinucleotide biosynthesis protein B [Berryella wangjianweii]